MTRLVLLRDCDACGRSEERVLVDSWTGKELCVECLLAIGNRLALSPATEGDNLLALLEEIG